jgi:hypothetical protein
MKLNCKVGDLAYVKTSKKTPELVGRVVVVVRAANETEEICGIKGRLPNRPGDQWWIIRSAVDGESLPAHMPHVDGPIIKIMLPERPVLDSQLRPIRDGEGPDETMVWKRREDKVTA